ncbi:MAG: hypothetical protein Q8M76_00915, partial [Spirochaetaceae bacterium]|nr:hypothetical protein [Spirochaetaceae bacterium]
IANGIVPDSEAGWLNGLSLDLESKFSDFFIKTKATVIWPSSVVYEGFIQDVKERKLTPITTMTVEQFYWGDLTIGYDIFGTRGGVKLKLAPTAGFGYRYWIRGLGLNSFQEHYSWAYVLVGESFSVSLGRWNLGADLTLEAPIMPRMATLGTEDYDAKNYPIRSLPGFRVDMSARYQFRGNGRVAFFAYASPYYQEWNIEGSQAVLQTHDGLPVKDSYGSLIYMLEPASRTNLFGIKAGLGMNF